MSEATFTRADDKSQVLAATTISARAVVQIPSGELGFLDDGDSVATGEYTDDVRSGAKATINKTTGVVLLAGQEGFWDDSARQVTYKRVNDRDRSAGVVVSDAASAALTALVDLNKRCAAHLDLLNQPCNSTPVGTSAAGGFGYPVRLGGSERLALTSTSEAQKVELISVDGVAVDAGWIAEFELRVESVGSGTAPDLSVGVADGTHATDADSIVTSAFIHMNGNDASLFAECDDGTNETNATDTTIDVTAGTAVANRVHILIDGRDLSSLKFYVNGARVLTGTTFSMAAASGTLFLLAHLEKTSAADTFVVHVDKGRLWIAD